jgi:hypothetical protein
VAKLAVSVVALASIVCEMAPPSDQLEKAYCVPPNVCGLVVAIVCADPEPHEKVCGAV